MHALASWLPAVSIIPATQHTNWLLVFWHPAGGVPGLNHFLYLFNVNCAVKFNFILCRVWVTVAAWARLRYIPCFKCKISRLARASENVRPSSTWLRLFVLLIRLTKSRSCSEMFSNSDLNWLGSSAGVSLSWTWHCLSALFPVVESVFDNLHVILKLLLIS